MSQFSQRIVDPIRHFLIYAAVLLILLIACDWNNPSWIGEPCIQPEPLTINTHVIWSANNHPNLIQQDIHVTPEGTLEILPGTKIPFLPASEIICDPAGNMNRNPELLVEGSFICRGKEDSTIRFFPNDLSDNQHMALTTINRGSENNACVIEWSAFFRAHIQGHSTKVVSSDIEYLDIRNSRDVEVVSNNLGTLSILWCGGVISENRINGSIYLRDDSMLVEQNIIHGNAYDPWGGITSSGSSKSRIVENCIMNCDFGIFIFSGSPEICYNDFINNSLNLLIEPFSTSPEADTISAQHNWWGSDDEATILARIEYRSNGGAESQKVILLEPYEIQPLRICK